MIKSLTLSIGLAMALATPAFATIEWTFNNNDNAAAASTGIGSAGITLGQFNTGWHDGVTLPFNNYGTATGFWDLGSSGSIVLSGMGLTSPVTLHVFQWVDPASPLANNPYSGLLTFSTSGGASGSLLDMGSTGNQYWHQYDAQFLLGNLDTVTVNGPTGGAIIDRMVLTVVPEPGTVIAGAILLIPFALSTFRVLRLRRRKTA